MAYTLARIDVKEIKKDVDIGVSTHVLPKGVVPIDVEGLSQLPDSSEPSVDEWSYFPKENLFKINLGAVDDLYVKYAILCSNYESAYYAAIDPTDDLSPKYYWQPYLDRSPSVVETGRNILEGIISYNTLTVPLAVSTDSGLRKMFGSNYSVLNQDFFIWRITNSGSIRKIYTGVGNGVSNFITKVTYEAKPKTKLLDEPAYYGLLSYNIFYKNGSYVTNPYVSGLDKDKNSVPLLCASVLPYTVKRITSDQWGTYVGPTLNRQYNTADFSTFHFDKQSLVRSRADHEGTKFKFFPGIVFSDFDASIYTPSVLRDHSFGFNYLDINRCVEHKPFLAPYSQAKNPKWICTDAGGPDETLTLPCDWANYDGLNRYIMSLRYYTNSLGIGPVYYFLGKQATVDPSSSVLNIKNRFKMLFTNTDKMNEFFSGPYETIDNGDKNDPNTPNTTDAPRLIPYDICTPYNLEPQDLYEQKSANNGAKLLMMEADLGTTSDSYTQDTIGSFYYDLVSQPAGDGGCFEYYMQWEIPVGDPSLSMQSWLSTTLKAAFETDSIDISELDFDESMQMVETTNQTYRELLEKLLPAIGCFITFDHDNEVPKLIKIDPTKAVVDTLTESDFWGFQARLNTQDTYYSVNLRNESMLRGDNTADNFLAYQFNRTYVADNALNSTRKEKFIPMLTMESSRGSTIAGWHTDNKFIYKWSCAAEDRYLDIKLGDMIDLESDLVLEPENRAKILVTQRSIDEDKVSFEGIKFASIN